MTDEERRLEEVKQPRSGEVPLTPASVLAAQAEPAREQKKLFRLTLRNAVYGDLLGAPGGGDFSLLEWDAESTTIRQIREAVAIAVLATWNAEEDAGRPFPPNRLHWEQIQLLSVPMTRRPSASPPTLSQPHPPAAQEDSSLVAAESRPELPTSRDSVGSAFSDTDSCLVDLDYTDVLLEDDGGKALLYDALRGHGAGAVQKSEDTSEMEDAGAANREQVRAALDRGLHVDSDGVRLFSPSSGSVPTSSEPTLRPVNVEGPTDDLGDGKKEGLEVFELKYFVRTFEAFANRKDVEQALALWLMEGAVSRATSPADAAPLDGAAEAQFEALQREQRKIENKYGPVRIWDLSLLSDLSALVRKSVAVLELRGAGFRDRYPDLQFVVAHALHGNALGLETNDFLCSFTTDISGWDVSGTTSMRRMFTLCAHFNSDLSAWNVCKVEDFSQMFAFCDDFNQNLASWNVGNGTDFVGMFEFCTSFNQHLYEPPS